MITGEFSVFGSRLETVKMKKSKGIGGILGAFARLRIL